MIVNEDQALTAEELQMLEGLLAKLNGRGAELPWPLFRSLAPAQTFWPRVYLSVADVPQARVEIVDALILRRPTTHRAEKSHADYAFARGAP